MGFQGYLERLTTQVAGGTEPDVMQINWAWLAMFSKRGTGFTDLRRTWRPGCRGAVQRRRPGHRHRAGRLNALPVSYTARVFLWNQGTFDQRWGWRCRELGRTLRHRPAFRSAHWARRLPAGRRALRHDAAVAGLGACRRTARPRHRPRHAAARGHEPGRRAGLGAHLPPAGGRRHVATPLPLRASLGGAEKPTEQQPDWVRPLGRQLHLGLGDRLRASTLRGAALALGEFPRCPARSPAGMFGRPALMYAVGRTAAAGPGGALVEFLLTDPEAARLLGRTRGMPAARPAFEQLRAAGPAAALELQAHAQIQAQRAAGRIPLPAPLFEHPRMLKFMREVFETVAYRKTTDEDAARRLVEKGNGAAAAHGR
jgi:oligogalacturonide transport system substrate-binding protein